MSSDAQDIAVARHLQQMGLASPAQVAEALQAQAQAIEKGSRVSLAEALVQAGVLTPAQRETVEKKAQAAQAGVQQLGRYKLLKKLGEGGMGAVYLAEEASPAPDGKPEAGRKVALKVLPRKFSGDSEFLKRFRREASAAIALKHPNIVGAYETGEDLGYHFYAMEYCEGESLEKVLKREGLVPWRRALEIVRQVAMGLGHAHSKGFVHRDIKPANIMVAPDGACRILDLGLSKNVGDAQLSFQTLSGAVLGTPHYISPEQARGDKTVDGRADIYSLGASLYHLVTGEPPFQGQSPYAIISQHVTAELPNPQDLAEDIPDALVHLLRGMMIKEPARRYRHCNDLIADVDLVLDGQSPRMLKMDSSASTVKLLREKIARTRRRKASAAPPPPTGKPRTALLIGGAAAGLILIVALLALSSGGKPPPRPPPPEEAVKSPPPARPTFEAWLASVHSLPGDEQAARVAAKLKELNPEFRAGSVETRIEGGHVTGLFLEGTALRDLSPTRALPRLRHLKCAGGPLEDLSSLKGLPLTHLEIPDTRVADLKPLEGLRLEHLDAQGTAVRDLRPLASAPLRSLRLSGAPVADLAPLAGKPLEQLWISKTKVSDLKPLLDLKELGDLWCDLNPARDLALLKAHPALRTVNGLPLAQLAGPGPEPQAKPPAEETAKVPDPPQPPVKPVAVPPAPEIPPGLAPVPPGATDLLALIDPAKHQAKGRKDWQLIDGVLVSHNDPFARVMIPYEPPEEYDLTIVAERKSKLPQALLAGLVVGGRQVMATIDGLAKSEHRYLEQVDGTNGAVTLGRVIPEGRAATFVYQVRKGSIRILMDGAEVLAWEGDPARLSMPAGWKVPNPKALAVGTWYAWFHIYRIYLAPPALPKPVVVARLPQPPAEALKKAEGEVRKLFKEEFAKPTAQNAKKLLELGLQTKGDPPGAYVLFREAGSMALQAGELDLALEAAGATARIFEVNARTVRAQALETYGKRSLSPVQAAALTERYFALADEAVEADEIDGAKTAAGRALTQAKRAGRAPLVARAQARLDEVTVLHREFERVPAALKTLEERPEDGPANLAAGAFYALVKGDWARGLPPLSRSSEAKLQKLAKDDLLAPAEPEAQAALAETWWERAETEKPGVRRQRMQERAAHWHGAAISRLAGLPRAKAEKRLGDFAAQRPPIDLLAAIDPAKDSVTGKWRAAGEALVADGGGSLQVPYEPPGCYDLTLSVVRKGAPNGLLVGIALEGRAVNAVVDLFSSECGLYTVNGEGWIPQKKLFLEDGRPATLVFRVRGRAVSFLLDGKPVYTFVSDPKNLSQPDRWKVPNSAALSLGVHMTTFEIQKFTVTPLSGRGKLLR